MGLVLVPNEVRSCISMMKSYLGSSVRCYLDILQKIEEYVAENELCSTSWEQSKETMHICYQVIAMNMLSVQESFFSDMNTLDGAIGDEYLDEDELQSRITLLEAESQQYENSITQMTWIAQTFSWTGLTSTVSNIIEAQENLIAANEAEIARLKEKIIFLHEVEDSTVNLFQSVIDTLIMVSNAIHDGGVVLSGGTDFLGSELLEMGRNVLRYDEGLQIDKLLNEELLIKVGFDIEQMKEVYGADVLEELRTMMLDAGICNEYSVAMFIATMAVESAYGTAILEIGKGGDSYTENVKGSGILQITGATQKAFLESMLETATDPQMREKIEIYCDNFVLSDEKNVSIRSDNIALTKDNGKYYDILEGKSCAEFIAAEYPLYSAVWFWNENNDNILQENMNQFISEMSGEIENQDNLFLIVQMVHNGTEYSGKQLKKLCQCIEDLQVEKTGQEKCQINGCVHFTEYCFTVPGEPDRHSYGPNGWNERKAAWNIVKGQIND